MAITANELKNNLEKYLLYATKKDIFITKDGKIVAKLTSPYQNKIDIAESLFGCISDSGIASK